MNKYKNYIKAKKLHNDQIVEILDRKTRQLNNIYGSLNFLELNPKYDNGSNARAIERLSKEIDALLELYNENDQ